MAWNRRLGGGFVAAVGFMLSPLSWWNDLIVNVPLAVGFAWLVTLVRPEWFKPAVVAGYWLTNVLGLVLLQKGLKTAAGKESTPYTRRELIKDLGIALLYTALILGLAHIGVLQPIAGYFDQP